MGPDDPPAIRDSGGAKWRYIIAVLEPRDSRKVEKTILDGFLTKKDAARIVRDHNAAPRLAAALEAIANDCDRMIDGDDMGGMSDVEIATAFKDAARAALAEVAHD